MNPRSSIDGFGYDISQFNPQPPQIFGAQDAEGNPIPASLPQGNYFSDLGDLNADDSDPKRRRIARACDMCRRKKIKCDGKLPKCGHCINYKTECVFTQVEKKRNPPKGAKYIEGLENRLGRMESLLKMSGLLNEEEAGRTDLGTLEKRLAEKARSNSQARSSNSPHPGASSNSLKNSDSHTNTPSKETSATSPLESMASPASPTDTEKQQEVESLSDMMCSLVTTSQGETRFIGSSSAFSIFSQKGIEWVNEKTGDSSFEETIQNAVNEDDMLKWQLWKPDVFGDLFMRRVFKSLPPKEEAMSLFKDFFENFNSMFPLFHEPTFMHLAERQYSSEPYEGSGWWACINVTLAIAHRIRVMSNVVPLHDDQKAWMYLKNAMGCLTELTMKNQDLLSVQALFGMALFLQGTPNPQPAFLLISSGLRLAHSIGLHKKGTSFNLHPIEAEQRKRVFWIGYMLDKDSSLRSGRPPNQDDDDMNVDLPSEDPPDNIGNIPLSDGKGKVNLFRLLCEFALISQKVYKNLYSVKASKQSDGELLNTIGDLDKELETWKDKIPIEFRPEHEIKTSHTPLILQIVVLHFSYYNCLTTIHRMSVHHGYWTSRLAEYAIQGLNARPLNPRIFSSAALCVSAARASVNLIKYLPQGDFACVWLIIYFPVSALVTIFANILQNPQDQRARADIKLMELVVNFLSNIVNEEGTGAFKRMLSICAEFTRIGRLVLDKAEKEGLKRKRKILPEENHQAMQAAMAQAQAARLANRATATSGMQSQAQTTQPANMANLNADRSAQTAFTPGMFNPEGGINLSNLGGDFENLLAQTGFSPNPPDANLSSNGVSPMNFNVGSFQQPFVPQDLWQMPMTFEWDWANIDPNYTTFDGSDGINVNSGMPRQ